MKRLARLAFAMAIGAGCAPAHAQHACTWSSASLRNDRKTDQPIQICRNAQGLVTRISASVYRGYPSSKALAGLLGFKPEACSSDYSLNEGTTSITCQSQGETFLGLESGMPGAQTLSGFLVGHVSAGDYAGGTEQ